MLDQRLHAMTAQITKMTPQQRQKFALLHKNDPILVGLTKHINDQDNALRQSLELQKKGIPDPNGPKVVDDVISQMAPGGLAKLPVPQLEAMPDGGIAGQPEEMPMGKPTTYKKGGAVKVKKYAGATGSWVQAPAGGITGGGVMGAMIPTPVTVDPTALERALKAAEAQKMQYEGAPLTEAEKARIVARFKQDPVRSQQMMAPPVPPSPVPSPNRQALQGNIPAAPQPASVPQPTPVAPTAPARQAAATGSPMPKPPSIPKGGGGGGYSLPAMPAPPQFGAIDIGSEMAKAKASLPSGPVAADEIKQLNESAVKGAEEERDRLKADQAALGEFGTEREKRLKSREEKLNKQESENKGLALLDAGLAMMAGKSPHALVNIGEGAMVGTRRYREGQKDIDAGRERLEDAFGRLEEIRHGDKRASMKEMREAEAGVRKATNEGIARIIDGISKREDINTKEATAMLEGTLRDLTSRREAESRQFSDQMRYRGGIESALIGAQSARETAGIHAGASNYAAQMRLKGDEMQASARKQEQTDLKWAQLKNQAYNGALEEVKMKSQGIGGLDYQQNPGLMERDLQRAYRTRAKALGVPESELSSLSADTGSTGAADFVYDPKTKRLTAPPR